MRDKSKFAEKIVALALPWPGNPQYWKYFTYKGKTYLFNFVEVGNGFMCKAAFEEGCDNYRKTPVEAILEELKDVWK